MLGRRFGETPGQSFAAGASPVRAALEALAPQLVGVGQLVLRLPKACFPVPKPFGVHVMRGEVAEMPQVLQGCAHEVRHGSVSPDDSDSAHCAYAVQYEFPWFPLLAGLSSSDEIRQSMAEAIPPLVQGGVQMARRWWLAYELFHEALPLDGLEDQRLTPIPFLPPERFFCLSGELSARHCVVDNLLGGKDFCPFVEKFAGAVEASKEFHAELLEVLSPICMLTVKEFFTKGGVDHGGPVERASFQRLVSQLADSGFLMSDEEVKKLGSVFCLETDTGQGSTGQAPGLVAFARWIRGDDGLASRLREHLLGTAPTDYRWHAPGEYFLERLSRVISHIETRASQMIEGELPPEKKARFFVDVISNPWDRDGVAIDAELCASLQQGLLSAERYQLVSKTQVEGEPRRINQNWVSSEKYDDMVGKVKVLHHLPPPPAVLSSLLDGYFACVQKMLADPKMDPIICATITKIAYNTLHPLVDGNGRVQRMLFQLVLFKFGFLPRLNIPVSVIMLQDRSGYEMMQGKHVEQLMAGVVYEEVKTDVGDGGDGFRHVEETERVKPLYQYQDFTFAASSMIKLMQSTLPVIAAKAYFLQRFDWRVDELLKGDALMPPRAATRIAKVFKNEGASGGISMMKLTRLLFLDGWRIGFRRVLRFLAIARHPKEVTGLQRVRQSLKDAWKRSQRRLWIMSSGQVMGSSSTGRVRWVGVSLEKFAASEVALKRALTVSKTGDTVMAVHYPKDMSELFSMDLFPRLAGEIEHDVKAMRERLQAKVQDVVGQHKPEGVLFRAFIGPPSAYRPAYSLCEDAKAAEVKPYRIYAGYDQFEHHRTFTDYVVRNAPCDVTLVKGDFSSRGNTVRWVGISSRNFDISGSALIKAFAHSKEGDTVIGVHYPVNPFEEGGMSSVYEAHMSSVGDMHLDVLMDSEKCRVAERAERIAEQWCQEGVRFQTYIGEVTSEPHVQLVRDAASGMESQPQPHTIYVGYNRRRDRDKLVDPSKLYDVAEYIVRHAPCNVVVVKESQQAMKSRIHGRRHLPVVSAQGP